MTASLPADVQRVFERFVTTELTTLDRHGHPVTWPVTPYYSAGGPCIDVTTGLGYPKKADDAARNPKVALLFSDATGSGLDRPPMVLVQGTAEVDDRDLDENRERYARESAAKLPGAERIQPPRFLRRFFSWYYTRIYVHVRPERVYIWANADAECEPELYDSHIEEVRSGHDEEPDVPHERPGGGQRAWDERIDELGGEYRSAVLSFVAPDGFPFSIRVPVTVDSAARLVRITCEPTGAPLQPGIACLAAHAHAEDFSWQRNFHVRGDLVEGDGSWAIVPHKLVGGFEAPPGGMLSQVKLNYGKMRRFRSRAREELSRRSS